MKRRAVVVIATLFLTACTRGGGDTKPLPSHLATPPSSPVPTHQAGSVTARLAMDTTVVHAGGSLHGILVVINNTGRPIPYCNGVAIVGLAKPGVPFSPNEPLSGCVVGHASTLPLGKSRRPVTIDTRFQSCTPRGRTSRDAPRCAGHHHLTIPPLPRGRYHTVVIWHLPPVHHLLVRHVRVTR
jgi:hypothetical protein